MGFDKIMHILLGGAAAMVVIALFAISGRADGPFAGVLAAIAIGGAKECYDMTGRGHVELGDFLATIAGGIAVYLWWPLV